MVTSTLDCAGCDMYDRKAYAASLTLSEAAWLMAPDQPPKAANGELFTPLVAYGQRVGLQSASCIVLRSSTCFEPGRITAPTLSMTFDCVLSTASEGHRQGRRRDPPRLEAGAGPQHDAARR